MHLNPNFKESGLIQQQQMHSMRIVFCESYISNCINMSKGFLIQALNFIIDVFLDCNSITSYNAVHQFIFKGLNLQIQNPLFLLILSLCIVVTV